MNKDFIRSLGLVCKYECAENRNDMGMFGVKHVKAITCTGSDVNLKTNEIRNNGQRDK